MLINLIENDQVDAFIEQVFNNKVGGAGGTYTIPLSADEEKTLLHRVLTDKKNNRWYKILADYTSHYPLSREAVDFLISGISSNQDYLHGIRKAWLRFRTGRTDLQHHQGRSAQQNLPAVAQCYLFTRQELQLRLVSCIGKYFRSPSRKRQLFPSLCRTLQKTCA